MFKAMKATFGVILALLICVIIFSLIIASPDSHEDVQPKEERVKVTADTNLENSNFVNYNYEVFVDGNLESDSYEIDDTYSDLDYKIKDILDSYVYPHYKVKEVLYKNVYFGKSEELDKGIFKFEGTLISKENVVFDEGNTKTQSFTIYYLDKVFDIEDSQYKFLRVILDGEDITTYVDIDAFLNN